MAAQSPAPPRNARLRGPNRHRRVALALAAATAGVALVVVLLVNATERQRVDVAEVLREPERFMFSTVVLEGRVRRRIDGVGVVLVSQRREPASGILVVPRRNVELLDTPVGAPLAVEGRIDRFPEALPVRPGDAIGADGRLILWANKRLG